MLLWRQGMAFDFHTRRSKYWKQAGQITDLSRCSTRTSFFFFRCKRQLLVQVLRIEKQNLFWFCYWALLGMWVGTRKVSSEMPVNILIPSPDYSVKGHSNSNNFNIMWIWLWKMPPNQTCCLNIEMMVPLDVWTMVVREIQPSPPPPPSLPLRVIKYRE